MNDILFQEKNVIVGLHFVGNSALGRKLREMRSRIDLREKLFLQ